MGESKLKLNLKRRRLQFFAFLENEDPQTKIQRWRVELYGKSVKLAPIVRDGTAPRLGEKKFQETDVVPSLALIQKFREKCRGNEKDSEEEGSEGKHSEENEQYDKHDGTVNDKNTKRKEVGESLDDQNSEGIEESLNDGPQVSGDSDVDSDEETDSDFDAFVQAQEASKVNLEQALEEFGKTVNGSIEEDGRTVFGIANSGEDDPETVDSERPGLLLATATLMVIPAWKEAYSNLVSKVFLKLQDEESNHQQINGDAEELRDDINKDNENDFGNLDFEQDEENENNPYEEVKDTDFNEPNEEVSGSDDKEADYIDAETTDISKDPDEKLLDIFWKVNRIVTDYMEPGTDGKHMDQNAHCDVQLVFLEDLEVVENNRNRGVGTVFLQGLCDRFQGIHIIEENAVSKGCHIAISSKGWFERCGFQLHQGLLYRNPFTAGLPLFIYPQYIIEYVGEYCCFSDKGKETERSEPDDDDCDSLLLAEPELDEPIEAQFGRLTEAQLKNRIERTQKGLEDAQKEFHGERQVELDCKDESSDCEDFTKDDSTDCRIALPDCKEESLAGKSTLSDEEPVQDPRSLEAVDRDEEAETERKKRFDILEYLLPTDVYREYRNALGERREHSTPKVEDTLREAARERFIARYKRNFRRKEDREDALPTNSTDELLVVHEDAPEALLDEGGKRLYSKFRKKFERKYPDSDVFWTDGDWGAFLSLESLGEQEMALAIKLYRRPGGSIEDIIRCYMDDHTGGHFQRNEIDDVNLPEEWDSSSDGGDIDEDDVMAMNASTCETVTPGDYVDLDERLAGGSINNMDLNPSIDPSAGGDDSQNDVSPEELPADILSNYFKELSEIVGPQFLTNIELLCAMWEHLHRPLSVDDDWRTFMFGEYHEASAVVENMGGFRDGLSFVWGDARMSYKTEIEYLYFRKLKDTTWKEQIVDECKPEGCDLYNSTNLVVNESPNTSVVQNPEIRVDQSLNSSNSQSTDQSTQTGSSEESTFNESSHFDMSSSGMVSSIGHMDESIPENINFDRTDTGNLLSNGGANMNHSSENKETITATYVLDIPAIVKKFLTLPDMLIGDEKMKLLMKLCLDMDYLKENFRKRVLVPFDEEIVREHLMAKKDAARIAEEMEAISVALSKDTVIFDMSGVTSAEHRSTGCGSTGDVLNRAIEIENLGSEDISMSIDELGSRSVDTQRLDHDDIPRYLGSVFGPCEDRDWSNARVNCWDDGLDTSNPGRTNRSVAIQRDVYTHTNHYKELMDVQEAEIIAARKNAINAEERHAKQLEVREGLITAGIDAGILPADAMEYMMMDESLDESFSAMLKAELGFMDLSLGEYKDSLHPSMVSDLRQIKDLMSDPAYQKLTAADVQIYQFLDENPDAVLVDGGILPARTNAADED